MTPCLCEFCKLFQTSEHPRRAPKASAATEETSPLLPVAYKDADEKPQRARSRRQQNMPPSPADQFFGSGNGPYTGEYRDQPIEALKAKSAARVKALEMKRVAVDAIAAVREQELLKAANEDEWLDTLEAELAQSKEDGARDEDRLAKGGVAPLRIPLSRENSSGDRSEDENHDREPKLTLEDLNREFEQMMAHFPEHAAIVKAADETFFEGKPLKSVKGGDSL